MRPSRYFILTAVVLFLVFASGCSQEAPVEEAGSAALPAADALAISAEPIGHWHVFAPKILRFSIVDAASDEGIPGLDTVVQIAQAESERVREYSVGEGDVQDEGEGVYSLEYTPSSIGSYTVLATAVKDGQHFASAPIAFEVAKAGEEGIKATADGTDYVYQIRYHFEPGHIHANDSEPVKMVFELMRGLETGADINWEQPWRNRFDHVNGLTDGTLTVKAEDGSVSEELSLAYQGRGIFEAERIFSADEVGESREYALDLSFTDAVNGATVSNKEPFHLHAVEGH